MEFCRQYFEQIYNAHVKLLSLLREGEEEAAEKDEETPTVSFEDEIMQYMRSYADRERPTEIEQETDPDPDPVVFHHPREIVKCEPEIPDLNEQEGDRKDPEEVRDPKHFLDELLDEYDGMDELEGSSGSVEEKRRSKETGLLVPPPLKKCGVCGLVSATHLENVAHWTAEHPDTEILYRCDWPGCQEASTAVSEVKKHRRKHLIEENQLVKCKDCDKYYPPKYLEQRHYLVHQESRNFKCEVCEKSFKTLEYLKFHARIHGPDDERYTHCCEVCGRKFTQKANLESHMRIHTGDRPFKCEFCPKSFSQKGNLDEHRRTHTGEKPYVCDICGSRHTRKGELLLHVRCIHTHERPFQCAYCPKNFQRRDLLRKHERIHTDTRPYGCEFCGKTFTARDKMIVHRRLHTGERPYICTTCGRGFCESGNLKKHMKVHGTEIPAVVKQNNKGLPAADTAVIHHRKTTQQQPPQPPPGDYAQGQARETEVRDEANNELRSAEDTYKSPDSVKSEMEDVGQAGMYRRNAMEIQQPGGYIMGVPGNISHSTNTSNCNFNSSQVNNTLRYISSSRFRTTGSPVTDRSSTRLLPIKISIPVTQIWSKKILMKMINKNQILISIRRCQTFSI